MIIHEVEQNSTEWDTLRCGIPTASEFKKMVTSQGKVSKSLEGYARQLAANKYAGKDLDAWEGNSHTERGHLLEDSSGAWYENSFPDRTVTQVGFITNDAGTAGCSPDFLVDSDGLLEVKNLKATRHIEVIQYYQLHKKAPPDYIIQCQGQMLVAQKDWCDLLFHHPDLPNLIIRQLPNLEIQAAIEVQIEMVIALRDTLISILENI